MSGEITELLARSLTLEELAERLIDHPDPIVASFARRAIDAEVRERESCGE